MYDHFKGANLLGYPDIRIWIFWMFGPYTAILKARKLKLGMDDHVKGANDLGYLDIRISASASASAVPCVVANLEMIINDLCINVWSSASALSERSEPCLSDIHPSERSEPRTSCREAASHRREAASHRREAP